MKCKSMVHPDLAADIQTVEQVIRKVSEARIQDLELKVLEALDSGLKITDLRITEVIEWTDKELVFNHTITVEKK